MNEFVVFGFDYRVAVTQDDSDVWIPMFAGFDADGAPILDYVEFLDRDALLVRGDVPISDLHSGRYAQDLPVSLAGETISIGRGWVSGVATTDTGSFRFVSTHLDDYSADVQMAQADELLGLLAAEKLPIVAVGDFNTRADGTGTPTYGMLTAARLTDVWKRANPRDPGYSCCTSADLHQAGTFGERIDLVFVREHGHAIKGLVTAKLTGTAPVGGLWASDHAGVVASFRIP